MVALLPNKKRVAVKLKGHKLHGDEKYRGNRLGCLGTLDESDYYVSDDDFCSYYEGCGLIDLGRYAPILREDIKTTLQFNLKEFIFSCVPNEWSYGVSDEEDLCYDITDDATGDPHISAQAQLPIYINEVGHNQSLEQNVFPRDKENGAVHYFFHQDNPLRKGTTVELFVNYLGKYELVRERKGYGLNNLLFSLKGDNDAPSRYHRNMLERKEIVRYIKSFNIMDIKEALQFLWSWVFYRVKDKSNEYIANLEHDQQMSKEKKEQFERQFIARRRISWLSKNISLRLKILRKESYSMELENILNDENSFCGKIIETLSLILWDVCPEIFGKHLFVAETYTKELSEELLSDISGRIYEPFNQLSWTPITFLLLQRIIHFLAQFYDEKVNDRAFKIFDVHAMSNIFQWLHDSCSKIHLICSDFLILRQKVQGGCKSSKTILDNICLSPNDSNLQYILTESKNSVEPFKVDVMNSPKTPCEELQYPFENIYKLQCVYIVHVAMTTFFERPSLRDPLPCTDYTPNFLMKRAGAYVFSDYRDWLKVAEKTRYPFGYSLKATCVKAGANLTIASEFINREEKIRLSKYKG